MSCLESETLRACLDGELTAAQALELEAHLAACLACRERHEELRVQKETVEQAMAALGPRPGQADFDAAAAYARMQARSASELPDAWFSELLAAYRSRRLALWGLAAATLVFVAAFTALAPARTWAQKVLEMLRVRQVTVVPVDSTLLPGPGNNSQTAQLIQELISDDVTITLKPGPPQPASTAAQASQLAGFNVRLLQGQEDRKRLEVIGPGSANMILHRDRLQAILDSTGRTDLKVPAAVDGAMLAIYVPKSVAATYGNCPPQEPSAGQQPSAGRAQADYSSCVEMTQAPSPNVSVPADLNLRELAEIGLQFTGMTADQAADFCKTVDWTSTLAIPVPRHAGSYSEVAVDGVKGVLLSGTGPGPSGYTLIWVKSGIVYAIHGLGDPAGATALGNSLGE